MLVILDRLMRLGIVVFALVALAAHLAVAQPTGIGKTLTPAQQAEIDKLTKDYSDAQVKQAHHLAVKHARQIYELRRKYSGDDSMLTWFARQSYASALQQIGDYTAAHAIYSDMLRQMEKQFGAESRQVLTALMPMTSIYWMQSRYDELEPLYQRMLALSKKLDGENSTGYALNLQLYGSMLQMKNELSSAQRVFEQHLKIQEAIAKSKEDVQVASALMLLANTYVFSNQVAKAIPLYDRMLAIYDKDTNSPMVSKASMRWSVASLYKYANRMDLAAPLLAKTVTLYKSEITKLEQTKPDDWQLPQLYGMLGYINKENNDLAGAEDAYNKAIAFSKKHNPTGFSGYESALGEIKRAQGKPREALALVERASAALAAISAQSATTLHYMRADIHRELGEYDKAERLLDEHRNAMVKQFGKKHPIYGATLLWASNVYISAGKFAQAEVALTDSLEAAERELANVLRSGTESDHAAYFSKNSYTLDLAVNFAITHAPKSAGAAKLALTTLLRRKGRVLDAAAASLATLRAKLSADDKKLLDELANARTKLSKLIVAGAKGMSEADFAKEVAALEDQIQKLELAIGKKSAAYRAINQTVDVAAVQKLIPRDARLVEIVNFQPNDGKGNFTYQQVKPPPRRYAAFTIGATGGISVVDLGPAAAIDTAIQEFRKAVADPDNDRAGDLGNALYKLTFAKIAPVLAGSTNVLVAPDGMLNVVPFSALVDDNKQFLVKKYTFTYLTSGRDLLRLAVKTKAQGGGVMFADPAFDATGRPTPAPASGNRGARSADLASLAWQPLPGTGQEADAVEKIMRGLKVYRKDAATESTVKSVHGPRILHLATHGFFLPDEPPPPPSDGGDRGGPSIPLGPAVGAAGGATAPTRENPLLRSGLAFAGANKLQSGDEDGILTAMEAAGLDLSGTKLVVLSACETGVGKTTNGDGVYGLRRALVIAGAESLVMSLWQVDDAATKDMMTAYYGKLVAGRPRSGALREVQLELSAKSQYAHPYYWASFLPAGDNSPLKD